MKPPCRHPGCRHLADSRRPGVCWKHLHSDWCHCVDCVAGRQPSALKTVIVESTNGFGDLTRAPVTMRKLPWETGAGA